MLIFSDDLSDKQHNRFQYKHAFLYMPYETMEICLTDFN